MRFLRQATASQEILLGPFVAAADGTAQTGLTIANTDIKLLLGGTTSEQNKTSGGGTHIAGGRYSAVLDATDTAAVGILEVSVNPASGIPWNKSYYVLEEAVYDQLFAASALGYIANAPVNVAQISGDSTAADNLETAFDDTAGAVPWQGIVDQGTAQSATGTTLVLRSAAAFTASQLVGATILITGGSAGVGERRLITSYASSTDTATVDAWNTIPTGTITYKIFATAPSSGGAAPSAATVAAAVWDLATAGHTTASTFGERVTRIPNAVAGAAGGLFIAGSNAATSITTALTANLIGNVTGSLSGSVGSVVGAVGSVTGNVGGNVVGSVASVIAQVTANVAQINGVPVIGAGTSGNLWRA